MQVYTSIVFWCQVESEMDLIFITEHIKKLENNKVLNFKKKTENDYRTKAF